MKPLISRLPVGPKPGAPDLPGVSRCDVSVEGATGPGMFPLPRTGRLAWLAWLASGTGRAPTFGTAGLGTRENAELGADTPGEPLAT